MQKSIESERLIYRPFEMADSKIIYHYMQNKEIIDNTLSIPYPYLENMAKEWIATHPEKLKKGEYQFAVQLEGRLREHKIKNGKFVDTVIRGLLASEWKK